MRIEKKYTVAPKHYYEWGNEPSGFVSTGAYIDGIWHSLGLMKKEDAYKKGLTYDCPYH